MNNRATLSIVAALIGVLTVAGISAAGVPFDSGSPDIDLSGAYPALGEPPSTTDRLSEHASRVASSFHGTAELDTVRFVGDDGDADHFIFTTEEGHLCLVLDPHESPPAMTCQDAERAAETGAGLSVHDGVGEPIRYAHLLPADHNEVDSTVGTLDGHLFTAAYKPGDPPDPVTVSGSAGKIRIGFPDPPAP